MDSRNSTTISDVSPAELRKTYEAELKKRDARKAELRKQLTRIENEVIKKMPAEDQRASEGPGRAAVLRKLKKFTTPEQDIEYIKLETEFQKLEKFHCRRAGRWRSRSITASFARRRHLCRFAAIRTRPEQR